MQLTRDRTHVPSEFQARQLSRSSGRSIPETFARVTNKCAAPVLAKDRPHATPPAEVDNRGLVLFDRGDEVVLQGGENGIRFLLVSGRLLQEPVAWYGPIVMNTQAELRQAFGELEQGTFLKQDQR